MMRRDYETVDELSLRLKGVLVDSGLFERLSVKGEVVGKKEHSSGVYFDLKGERSLLSCVVWKDVYARQKEPLEEGSEVVCHGALDYYPPRGRLSFKVYSYEKEGAGAKDQALKALYRKLKSEGLFDRPKKKLPAYPRAIALVAGYRSAAESDVLKNAPRRWPLAEIVLFPALVQGERAPESLAKALAAADASDCEVVILARGGGSSDDLSSFNDERVVRAVANMKKPIVSAVGHEIDISLTDFAADCRASTPTAASELVTPSYREVLSDLDGYEATLDSLLKGKIEQLAGRLDGLRNRPFFLSPLGAFAVYEEKIGRYEASLRQEARLALRERGSKLEAMASALKSLGVERTLARGYAYLTDEEDKPIVNARELTPGRRFLAHLQDGTAAAEARGEK